MLSLLLKLRETVDCWLLDSVRKSSDSSLSFWLSLRSTVLVGLSGWLNEVFIPLGIVKAAITADEMLVAFRRTWSIRPKLVTSGSLPFVHSSSSTGLLPLVLKAFLWANKVRCIKETNDKLSFWIQAWLVRTTLSASPFARGWKRDDAICLIYSDSPLFPVTANKLGTIVWHYRVEYPKLSSSIISLFVNFRFPQGRLLFNLIPPLLLLLYYLGLLNSPIHMGLSRTAASSQVDTVFPRQSFFLGILYS